MAGLTHIVYGIDDGADDREMSLRLIDMEYNQQEAEEKYPGLKLYRGREVKCFRNEMAKTIDRIKSDIFPPR